MLSSKTSESKQDESRRQSPPKSPNNDEKLKEGKPLGRSIAGDGVKSPKHNSEDLSGVGSGCIEKRQQTHDLETSKMTVPLSKPSPTKPKGEPNSTMKPPSPYKSYNSDDEHDTANKVKKTDAEWLEEERLFEKEMLQRGYLIKKIAEDGACLFRAVAYQIYGNQEVHSVVRKRCMDYIVANSEYFSPYVTEDFGMYVRRKRELKTHGNHIEIQAMSEMYQCPIKVFSFGKKPVYIYPRNFISGNEPINPRNFISGNEPIRLSYHRGTHYNSVVRPHHGTRVRLPNSISTDVEHSVKTPPRQKEETSFEQAVLEAELKVSDWEAAEDEIEAQVAKESLLQWLREYEEREEGQKSHSPGNAIGLEPTDAGLEPSKPSSSQEAVVGASSSEMVFPEVHFPPTSPEQSG